MNSVQLTGRVVKDPEVRYTTGSNPLCIAKFTLAVDRPFKREGQPDADYPRIVVLGKRAEWVKDYVKQGTALEIPSGRIETGSYEKDGVMHYTTDVVTNDVNFAMINKGASGQSAPAQPAPQAAPVQPQPAPQPAPQQEYAPPTGFAAIKDDDIPF